MRGLGRGTIRSSGALKAAMAAMAAIAAIEVFVSACVTGGTGARDEGPADSNVVAKAVSPPPPPPPTAREPTHAEVVQIVMGDPQVAKAVKENLKPCVADEYPVDVSYGGLTGGNQDDIVVNVLTCGDAVGIGSYVYQMKNHRYQNVFKAEEPPVYAEIDRGDLVVTQQMYEKDDPVSYPSREEVITYSWRANHFTEFSRTRNEYGNAVSNSGTVAPTEN